MSLGERLTAEQPSRGLAVFQAAVIIGADEGALGRRERGEWKPQARSPRKIEKFLLGASLVG